MHVSVDNFIIEFEPIAGLNDLSCLLQSCDTHRFNITVKPLDVLVAIKM